MKQILLRIEDNLFADLKARKRTFALSAYIVGILDNHLLKLKQDEAKHAPKPPPMTAEEKEASAWKSEIWHVWNYARDGIAAQPETMRRDQVQKGTRRVMDPHERRMSLYPLDDDSLEDAVHAHRLAVQTPADIEAKRKAMFAVAAAEAESTVTDLAASWED